jgi:hypothetical protein
LETESVLRTYETERWKGGSSLDVADVMEKLLKDAKENQSLRAELLSTRQSKEPMKEFCELASEKGYPISMGDLIAAGEEYSCNQLKSTNGGGVNPYTFFDDPYEMFFASLEYFDRLYSAGEERK